MQPLEQVNYHQNSNNKKNYKDFFRFAMERFAYSLSTEEAKQRAKQTNTVDLSDYRERIEHHLKEIGRSLEFRHNWMVEIPPGHVLFHYLPLRNIAREPFNKIHFKPWHHLPPYHFSGIVIVELQRYPNAKSLCLFTQTSNPESEHSFEFEHIQVEVIDTAKLHEHAGLFYHLYDLLDHKAAVEQLAARLQYDNQHISPEELHFIDDRTRNVCEEEDQDSEIYGGRNKEQARKNNSIGSTQLAIIKNYLTKVIFTQGDQGGSDQPAPTTPLPSKTKLLHFFHRLGWKKNSVDSIDILQFIDDCEKGNVNFFWMLDGRITFSPALNIAGLESLYSWMLTCMRGLFSTVKDEEYWTKYHPVFNRFLKDIATEIKYR